METLIENLIWKLKQQLSMATKTGYANQLKMAKILTWSTMGL